MNDAPAAATGSTPMMKQYLEIKAANPDCLLFYRMGDFYELFFDDAEAASRALGIALTRRGKHMGDDIPMCGVPVHAANDYLQKLIRLGHRVAVAEQMEDPREAKQRGYKAVVKRDVVRLVTPGTITEEALLDARRHNYLAALARVRGDAGLAIAWADISSGEFAVTSIAETRLGAELARLEPGELLVPDTLLADEILASALKSCGAPVSPLPASRFDSASGERRLTRHFALLALDALGAFSRAETAALGGLLDYIVLTQAGRAPLLRPPRREEAGGTLSIDPATRANLELTRTLSGERRGSLEAAIDMTVTAAGARTLRERLAAPLTDPQRIGARLDAIGHFLEARPLREALRQALSALPDAERALARLGFARGGPRDLEALRDHLRGARAIGDLLRAPAFPDAALPPDIGGEAERLAAAPFALVETLDAALGGELPILARDGGFVRAGHLAELDESRALRDETKQVIAALQGRYARETGIKSLKIRHNNVLGYYVEVGAQNAPALGDRFVHRQTMAGAMRFATVELSDLESRIARAAGRALALELEVFAGLCTAVQAEAQRILAAAAALAELDVSSSLAELAERRRYCRPRVDGSRAFGIAGGRHPVVEAMLSERGEARFVANDCDLGGKRLWLLTGPNMAGKSTFLRQNALILILAQMGSFVPAEAAHIGAADRLFSRVGAADDLARGRSTFMVEMVETAAILNQASERSFVILDEIGRGTATFDGLSIAWATIERLHEVNRCRALFATHYHELTALSSKLASLANATVKVREFNGEPVFLHEVVPGAADRSYGIQVARLAGLPAPVVARAEEVLNALESSERSGARKDLAGDLPLFAAPRPRSSARAAPSAVEAELAAIRPDDLAPREALELLYRLKALIGRAGPSA